MNTIKKIIFLLFAVPLFLYFTFFPFGNDDNKEITSNEIREHVKYLASDVLGGRFPGTEGDELAAKYIIGEFEKCKVEPKGDDGFHQWFEYTSEVKVGAANELTLKFDDGNISFTVEKDFLPSGASALGKIEAQIVFAGYGIKADSLNYNDFANIDVKNKIVFILRESPGIANPHDNKFSAYEQNRRKISALKDMGAAGVIIANGPESSEDELQPIRVVNESMPFQIISVKKNVAEKIFEKNGFSLQEVQKKINETQAPNSFDLQKGTALINVDLTKINARTSNILGFVEGNDPVLKNEVIVIGAHHDHLGDGMKYGSLHQPHEPAIHNGADDNASGTAGVIELAEKISSERKNLKRSYLFMLFSAEEAGLLGSVYFVKSELFKKFNIVSMINLDMVGRLKDNKLIIYGTGTSTTWLPMLDSLNKIHNFSTAYQPEGFGPSDHSSFYAKNIPVLFFFTGFHEQYHRPADDWELINTEGEEKVVKFVYDISMTIGSIKVKPDYLQTKEQGSVSRNSGFKVTLGIFPDYSSTVEGLGITGVRSGGVGEKAGLVAGDIIVKLGQYDIKNIYDYTDALSKFKKGEEIEIVVMRGTDKITLKGVF